MVAAAAASGCVGCVWADLREFLVRDDRLSSYLYSYSSYHRHSNDVTTKTTLSTMTTTTTVMLLLPVLALNDILGTVAALLFADIDS